MDEFLRNKYTFSNEFFLCFHTFSGEFSCVYFFSLASPLIMHQETWPSGATKMTGYNCHKNEPFQMNHVFIV